MANSQVDPGDLQAVDPGDLEQPTQTGVGESARRFGELLKGAGRGVYGLAQSFGKPLAEAIPKQLRLQPNPAAATANKQITSVLAPNPNANFTEKAFGTAAEFAGGMFAGGVPKMASNAASVFPARQVPAVREVARELHQAGLPVLPSQTGAGGIQRNLEAFGGSETVASHLQRKAQPTLQKLAAADTNLPAGANLTEAALQAASKEVADATYAPIRNLKAIHLGHPAAGQYAGSTFHRELDSIAGRYKSIEQSSNVNSTIKSLREARMPAEIVLERVQQIRNDASTAFRDGSRNHGKALREIADAVEDQIERNLPKGSKILDAYKAGRTQIAKNYAVKDMLVDKHTGMIDSTKAQGLLEDGTKLTGNLLTIAKSGSPVFAATTKPPIGGEKTIFNWRDIGLMGTPAVARGLVSSKLGQHMATKNPLEPSVFGMSPEMLRRLGTGAAPLFSQGEE